MRRVINSIFAEDAAGGTEFNGSHSDGPTYNFLALGNAYIWPGATVHAYGDHNPTTYIILGDFHDTTNASLIQCIGWIPSTNAAGGGAFAFGQKATVNEGGVIVDVINSHNNCVGNYSVGNFNRYVRQDNLNSQSNTFVSFHYQNVSWAPEGTTMLGMGNVMNRNHYYMVPPGAESGVWRIGGVTKSFGDIQTLGWEANGDFHSALPPTNTVWLRRSDYDARLATLTIINWSHSATVPVDLSTDVTGRPFCADNKNYKAVWVLNYSNTYTSGTKNGIVNFPMTGGPGLEQSVGPGLGVALDTRPECWSGVIILTN